ncbi:MAG: hypothetical protein D6687_09985 [Acidobacteria bacterium]|jgi:hypothetical protein|nr:MAG: hypothetical protein D6687_09985 [Acidobacteriota bacterium]
MKSLRFILLFVFVSTTAFSQTQNPKKSEISNPITSSPAYAEVLLRKVELESSLEDLLVEFTDDSPKVKETRYELELMNKELEKIRAMNPNDASKLTLALGKLIIRKVQLEVDLWLLLQRYTEEYEGVKRARKKLVVFENAIKEILGK